MVTGSQLSFVFVNTRDKTVDGANKVIIFFLNTIQPGVYLLELTVNFIKLAINFIKPFTHLLHKGTDNTYDFIDVFSGCDVTHN